MPVVISDFEVVVEKPESKAGPESPAEKSQTPSPLAYLSLQELLRHQAERAARLRAY